MASEVGDNADMVNGQMGGGGGRGEVGGGGGVPLVELYL